jgi:hypothetical protein
MRNTTGAERVWGRYLWLLLWVLIFPGCSREPAPSLEPAGPPSSKLVLYYSANVGGETAPCG